MTQGAPEAVLFDLDGTLLNTLDDLADAMNRALREMQHPEHPVQAYRQFIGDGMEMLARRALPEPMRDQETVCRLVASMRRRYAMSWDVKTRPYPGVPAMLDRLQRQGVPLAILSNKPHDFAVKTVEQLLADWHFDPVFGQRPGVPRKPDPAVALEICAHHGIEPERWILVGDSGSDMDTAMAAGMRGVGVLWGFRGAEELQQHGAWRLAASPEELLRLLLPEG